MQAGNFLRMDINTKRFRGYVARNRFIFYLDFLYSAYDGRLRLFASFPGTLALRASCFTRRLCLRCPLDGRLGLVFSMTVFNCSTPYIVDQCMESSMFMLTSADPTPPHR